MLAWRRIAKLVFEKIRRKSLFWFDKVSFFFFCLR